MTTTQVRNDSVLGQEEEQNMASFMKYFHAAAFFTASIAAAMQHRDFEDSPSTAVPRKVVSVTCENAATLTRKLVLLASKGDYAGLVDPEEHGIRPVEVGGVVAEGGDDGRMNGETEGKGDADEEEEKSATTSAAAATALSAFRFGSGTATGGGVLASREELGELGTPTRAERTRMRKEREVKASLLAEVRTEMGRYRNEVPGVSISDVHERAKALQVGAADCGVFKERRWIAPLVA